MAVTSGHGNPKWTREEVILALELYHRVSDSIPGPSDERVVSLSQELRSLPYHSDAAKKASFRNPDGVAFKLQNIRQVATGHGLGNTSKMDREVWGEYGADPIATSEAAARIRQGIKLTQLVSEADVDFEVPEGRSVTEAHQKIERNPTLRKRLLRSRKAAGTLRCDICTDDGAHVSDGIRDALFEAHHRVPLSRTRETKTKLSDLALLCANCHRLLHRLMNKSHRWMDLNDIRIEMFRSDA